jgi:hypothetical protein
LFILFARFDRFSASNNCQQQQLRTTPPPTTTTMTTPATEDQTRKREQSTITPRSNATNDFATRSFASLPMPIKSLATHYTETLIKLQNKARQRSITIEKMAEDTFIPTSARIKFELGATQKVKETATFTNLAEATKTLVETFQQALKTNMVTVAQLELKSIQTDIDNTFLETTRDLATLIVMNHFPEAENYTGSARKPWLERPSKHISTSSAPSRPYKMTPYSRST